MTRSTSVKAALLPVLLCAMAAHADTPPINPWTDTEWNDVLFGLKSGKVARVRMSQQLFDIHTSAGGVMITRDVQIEFEAPGARVSRLVVNGQSRGERPTNRSFRYVYEAGHLRRIDEDGHAAPAVMRRYDDPTGRVIEHTERLGAFVTRTTWRHDAAGRLLERRVEGGSGSRTLETRHYRRDGTLERLNIKGGMSRKRVDFDRDERPVRIQASDDADRHETNVTYPSATEAVHATTGHSSSLRGAGPYEYTTHYRVRTPQEQQRVEAPEFPTLRRHVRDKRHDEVQTEYAANGSVLVERRLDAGGNVVCIQRTTYHPSGPPAAVRNERMQPKAACGHDLDNEIKTDEQGNWAEQRMTTVLPDGQRRLMAVQARRVEYAP